MGDEMDQLAIEVKFLAAKEKPAPKTILYTNPLDRNVYTTHDWPNWEVILTRYSDNYNEKTIWEVPEELKEAWKFTTGSHVHSIHIVNGGQRSEL